ncbi:MAG: endolytic transglycosylase MltG, partial [Muribaculaceae bacterium]|nr:endolytic transglycosylase MltG [Muribaculaceae bacterium]
MTVYDISRKILNGRQDPVKVVFNNVRTLGQLADKVASKMEFDASAFSRACDSVLASKGLTPEQRPAAFLPDTYEFYWNASPEYVVERLAGYHDKFWNDERRRKADVLGLTPVEVATLASIVEEETAKVDERPKVARLYLNRIRKGMKLQADPTVKFAVGDFSLRRILGAHLKVESPYNTYLHEGLPPGPIRVVDKRTLDAVLDAPAHDYVYMCAKEDFSGYHNFAVTFAEHQANADRYRRELNRRGIR